MTASDSAEVSTEAQGLVIERVFDAPRELVWRAWTEPEHVMRWYGPAGMTSHACEIDLRVGGRCLWGMRSPDGGECWNTGVYREIVPPERFVATQSIADEHGNVVSAATQGMGEDFPLEMLITVLLVGPRRRQDEAHIAARRLARPRDGRGRERRLEPGLRQAGGRSRGHVGSSDRAVGDEGDESPSSSNANAEAHQRREHAHGSLSVVHVRCQ